MATITLVRGDKNYYLEFEVRDAEGKIVDLTNCTVRFKMQKYNAPSLVIDKVGTVVDGTNGLCQVMIGEELINESGEFKAELEITWPTGQVLTAPNIFVRVLKDLPS
jgi:hypothetical protein